MSADAPASTVADDGYAALDRYAERSLQAIDRSEIVPEMPARLVRRGIYLLATAVALTVALLYVGKVEVAVSANGAIVAERDALSVLARYGGVVRSVRARAGDRLPAGAPIATVDVQASAVDPASLARTHQGQQAQLESARASLMEIDRLLANPQVTVRVPADARSTIFVGIRALENARLALAVARQDAERLSERRRLQARQIELMRDYTTLTEQRHAAQARVLADQEKALAGRLSRLMNRRALAASDGPPPLEQRAEEEEYRSAESDLLTSRQRLAQQAIDISNQKLRQLDLERALATLAPEAASGLRQAELAYEQGLASLREERQTLSSRVDDLSADRDATAAAMAQADGRPAVETITMPIAGTLVDLAIGSPGSRIAVGTVVAAVAPADVPLAIEAVIPNKDVGFVTPGLEARITVDAYPHRRFGTARAQVERVLLGAGPDNTFRVRLRLLDDRLGRAADAPRLFPGLTVVAEIRTTKQRLIDLLFSKDSGPGKQE
jgi:multidrug resistance efflux pump